MTDLVMPKFGLTMTEGLLTAWHVAPGAAFRAGDVLFTVETEKVANDIEAEADGILAEILVAEGETVPVGQPVARLRGAGAAPTSPAPASDADPAPRPRGGAVAAGPGRDHGAAIAADLRAPAPPEGVRRVVATPLARRLAAQKGVDLSRIAGSGPRGRIKARDVESAACAGACAPAPAAAGRGSSGGAASTATRVIPDAIRLATAQRVSAAKREIPHFYLTHEAELTALLALREQLNADAAPDLRISVTHMLIRALGLALAERPALNRIWAGDHLLAFAQADIGIVAETPGGLRVPVVRDAGGISLDAVAAQARALTRRARSGTLGPADVGGGVIAVSNVGMMGVTTLTPIINPPNAMILGVGAERQLFRPDDRGAPALRRELTLTLACDHRIIDGADAARFLADVVAILETPLRLLRPAKGAAAPSAGD